MTVVPGAACATWFACGLSLHAAAAAANSSDDDDWPWTQEPWYATSVLLAECVSAVCVALALTAYACILKQQDISNYVKHYLACLLSTILVGIGGRAVPERLEPYYCTYFRWGRGRRKGFKPTSNFFSSFNYPEPVMHVYNKMHVTTDKLIAPSPTKVLMATTVLRGFVVTGLSVDALSFDRPFLNREARNSTKAKNYINCY